MTVTLDRPRRSGSYGAGAIDRAVDQIRLAGRSHAHTAIYAAACGLAELAAGGELTEPQIDRAVGLLIQVGTTARNGDQAEVRRTIDAAWRRGTQQPRTAPIDGLMLRDRVDAIEAISRWWSVVCGQPAPDRRWATTLKILAALALNAVAAGCTTVSVSHRQLAEDAGVSAGTITKHRAALAPWARLDAADRATALASRWTLIVTRSSGNIPATAGQEAPRVFPDAHPMLAPSHNLWHRWSGGWSTLLCLAHQPDPVSSAKLAEQVGRTPRSMTRILFRLNALGLVTRTVDGWIADLDQITPHRAEELHQEGVDHLAFRRERHRAEREVWAVSPIRKNWQHARQAAKSSAVPMNKPDVGVSMLSRSPIICLSRNGQIAATHTDRHSLRIASSSSCTLR